MAVYVYRPGFGFRVDPNVTGKELERIRKKYNQLAPRHVVAEAEPETAPLHDCFEWDDAKAANSFREVVARNLIRSVQIVREQDQREPMYVHVRREKRDDNSYEPASVVVNSPDMFAVAIEELRDNMAAAAENITQLLQMSIRRNDRKRSKPVARAAEAIDEAREAVLAIP